MVASSQEAKILSLESHWTLTCSIYRPLRASLLCYMTATGSKASFLYSTHGSLYICALMLYMMVIKCCSFYVEPACIIPCWHCDYRSLTRFRCAPLRTLSNYVALLVARETSYIFSISSSLRGCTNLLEPTPTNCSLSALSWPVKSIKSGSQPTLNSPRKKMTTNPNTNHPSLILQATTKTMKGKKTFPQEVHHTSCYNQNITSPREPFSSPNHLLVALLSWAKLVKNFLKQGM